MSAEWSPISTAPKDGTEILAYSEHGCTGTMLVRHIALCDFLTDSEGEEYSRQGGSEEAYYEADWFAADFVQGERLSADCYPTHWQPLPAPPAAQGMETRSAETEGLSPKGDSPVAESDAQNPSTPPDKT